MKPKDKNKRGQGQQRKSYNGYEAGTVMLLKSRNQSKNIVESINKCIQKNTKGFCRFILLEE